MAFDFNTITSSDDELHDKLIKEARIFQQPVSPVVYHLLNQPQKFTGFKEEYLKDANLYFYSKRVENAQRGIVYSIRNLCNMHHWTFFKASEINADPNKLIDLIGEEGFNKLKAVCNGYIKYLNVYVSPDNGVVYIITWFNYCYTCGFCYTGIKDYCNEIDNNKQDKKQTSLNEKTCKFISKIVKQYYDVKISPKWFKPVDINGAQMAMVSQGTYMVDMYKNRKKMSVHMPNFQDLNRLLTFYMEVPSDKIPDFVKNISTGEIKYLKCGRSLNNNFMYDDKAWTSQKTTGLYVVPDVFSWCDLQEDGTFNWYVAVSNNYKHDEKTGAVIFDYD